MRSKARRNKWTGFDTVITVISIIAIIITLYPMVYVFSCSISDPKAVLAGKVLLWPVGFSLEAYKMIFKDSDLWRSLIMTVFYVVASCLLMFFTTVTMAYPLTRPNLKFRKLVTYYLLIPMYFGGGLIPAYIVICRLGLYNTVWALILPGAVGIYNIILCRTYIASLPQELIESAMMDGCDHFRSLIKIVIPLAKPVMAVIMIFTIVGVWNSWFNASIYTTKQELQPLQLYVKKVISSASGSLRREIMEQLSFEERQVMMKMAFSANQIKYAVIFVSSVPIIAVYPMFQKHFTKGIMLGSLKG